MALPENDDDLGPLLLDGETVVMELELPTEGSDDGVLRRFGGDVLGAPPEVRGVGVVLLRCGDVVSGPPAPLRAGPGEEVARPRTGETGAGVVGPEGPAGTYEGLRNRDTGCMGLRVRGAVTCGGTPKGEAGEGGDGGVASPRTASRTGRGPGAGCCPRSTTGRGPRAWATWLLLELEPGAEEYSGWAVGYCGFTVADAEPGNGGAIPCEAWEDEGLAHLGGDVQRPAYPPGDWQRDPDLVRGGPCAALRTGVSWTACVAPPFGLSGVKEAENSGACK